MKFKLTAVSNHDKYVIFTFLRPKKLKDFDDFLIELLTYLGVKDLPDLNGIKYSENSIENCDMDYNWDDDKLIIHEVIGYKKIFLTVFMEKRDKIVEFIEKNTEWVK
jgi:thiazole synthase ThiGH ThiG subunit